MKVPIISMLVILLIGLSACTPTAPGETIQATGMILQSEKQREQSPEVAPANSSSLTNGNSVFAFNLYKLLSQEEGNLFYSPYSISAALAMTYAGVSVTSPEGSITSSGHQDIVSDGWLGIYMFSSARKGSMREVRSKIST